MGERPYHHGNLRIGLIEEGLALIHDEGRGNFSLRKLARRLNVSPTACYNHFPTAEALLEEMRRYVTERFCGMLSQQAADGQTGCATLRMGRDYVDFFARNPHYFSFLYEDGDLGIRLTEDSFEGEFEPFRIFRAQAFQEMERCHVPPEERRDNLLVMWAAVHGLAAMANMKGFHYDGDWGALTEKLLSEKITLF